jgi:hypothetical protein
LTSLLVGPAWASIVEVEPAVAAATSCAVVAVAPPSVRAGKSRLAAVPTYLWAADI